MKVLFSFLTALYSVSLTVILLVISLVTLILTSPKARALILPSSTVAIDGSSLSHKE